LTGKRKTVNVAVTAKFLPHAEVKYTQ